MEPERPLLEAKGQWGGKECRQSKNRASRKKKYHRSMQMNRHQPRKVNISVLLARGEVSAGRWVVGEGVKIPFRMAGGSLSGGGGISPPLKRIGGVSQGNEKVPSQEPREWTGRQGGSCLLCRRVVHGKQKDEPHLPMRRRGANGSSFPSDGEQTRQDRNQNY